MALQAVHGNKWFECAILASASVSKGPVGNSKSSDKEERYILATWRNVDRAQISSSCDYTFNVPARREKSPFASEDGENRIGMLIQFAKRIYRLWQQSAAVRIQELWAIEL